MPGDIISEDEEQMPDIIKKIRGASNLVDTEIGQ